MSIQVVRIEGYNKGSLGTIGRECDRADVNHRNQEIDKSLSHLNHSYKDASQGFVAEYSDIVTSLNAQGKTTKNGIAFEGMIITADLPFFERLGYQQGKPLPKEVKNFFDSAYAFAQAQIGYQGTDKNILSAKIHLDEKTPHLHLYYVPVTEKWQSKVYAKDENGKVLRTEKGTPIQAKDENGKTLYEQHEDSTSPKLSRSEFWRVRGGQFSYRQMQDRFHEEVGKAYQLERGELGSDREHKTTAQYKAEQLKQEKDALVAQVSPYRKLKTGIEQIETPGKTVLPGVVAIKKKDLETLQEQAKAYTVNRDEIQSLRKRTQAVKEREVRADSKEQELDGRMAAIQQQEQKVQLLYQRQANVNTLLQNAETDRDRLKRRVSTLEVENGLLRAELGQIKEKLSEHLENFKETVRGAYTSLANVVKACGMLKYDKDDGYGIENLSKKQERLIDGIAEYGAKWAKEDGFADIAEDMEKHVGISKGIREVIEPPRQQHSRDNRDYGPSL